MEFLTDEPLALDLVNTRAPGGQPGALDNAEGFQQWITRQSGRLPVPRAAPSDADLAVLRELRDCVADTLERIRQGVAPAAEALDAINEAAHAAPAYRVIAWQGTVLESSERRDGDDLARLLTEFAEAAAELLTDPAVTRVRQCQGPGCRMLFLPANPRRRWCSPALCGNRVRVARYYQRHHG